MTTIQEARDDWAALRNALLATEKAIATIIAHKSWEPLGYNSFSTAWAAEMRDITLASEIRPHVAFYMFQDGYGPEWVAEHLKGIGGKRADEWRREWTDGVPPEGFNRGRLHPGPDETIVETHLRKKPSKPAYIRFEVGATIYQEYKRIAKKMGVTVEEIARSATADTFRSLIREDKKNKVA